MFKKIGNFFKKKILKSIVKDITKTMPTLKQKAVIFIIENIDDVLVKVNAAIKKAIVNYARDNKLID